MKKLMALIIIFTMGIASSAKAACTAGTVITGSVNGASYCVSHATLNWWSAFAWCQAQGYHLATWKEACPHVEQGAVKCPNINSATGIVSPISGERGWLANPANNANSGVQSTFVVFGNANSGFISRKYVELYTSGYRSKALCVM